ncbi:MAG TPA: outer membrane beta-barrel protein [Methyloceanibacter sp.]|nr:outer membrane beta-barrel protein [Methyloceanibacter sp.]
MPRRHTPSAAGALAAALTVAVLAPAAAQDAAGPPLRGSIVAQDAEDNAADSAASRRRRESRQDDTGAALNNLADDTSLTPAPPAPPPPLGGMGDEQEEPVPAVPGFGITDAAGQPLVEPPSIDDDLEQLPLPPKGHELDPYVPIGMKLGSFLLFTEAEVGTILTDNVLGTRLRPQADAAFEFAPNVRLESNWSRHSFTATFDADRSWYNDFSVEDDKTYFALLRGRLDVTRRTYLALALGKSETQEGRNSVSLTDISGLQTSIQEEHITAGADHTFNRLTVAVEGSVTDYNYADLAGTQFGIIDPVVPTIIPTRDIRDYREDELKLRGTYELKPQLGVFVEGGISQEVYRQPISVDGVTRDSSGYELLSGMTFGINSTLTGEFSLGWGEQTSIDESVAPIEGVLLNADIIWRPTPMTMMEFLARSEVNTSTLVDSLGAIDRFYELSLQHAFWRYLVVGGFVSYEIADYAASPQVDERIKEGASAEYYFNPALSVYARYEHTDFFSTDRLSDFDQNEVRIGMRIRH